jgi:hypothetical protein
MLMASTPRPTAPAAPGPAVAPTAAERERAVQALSAHFASDRLSMEEFESRLERAYKAVSVVQLQALCSDVPAVEGQPAGAASALLVPSGDVPARGMMIAVMGGNERGGSWIVPRHFKVFAFMGGADIDLREARFGPGVTEIDVTAVMGGVGILVPPGVRVECFGAALMGSFEGHVGDATALSALHPTVRISGIAIMGGVEARTRARGEKVKKGGKSGAKRGEDQGA